jgi:hypothetical protein
VHGEAKRCLEQILVVESRAQAEHHLRDAARQIARQLRAPALDEQIDDGQVVAHPTHGLKSLAPVADDVDDVSLAPQQSRQGVPTSNVAVNQ